MKRLNGKVAIVTGSSSGIGKAIALRFAQEGAMVVVAARRLYKCEETVAQIEAAGGTALPLQTDVADESQVERLIGEIVRRFQRLDILVNNAGIFGGRRLAETSTEAFDEVADDLVDASAGERAGSEKIDPFDIAETALYLACLAPQSAVHQIVVDRMGADW
jgi:NAD(P)-dependent dehydrogenase (short-subunit alcohol dehydrogenase family)